MIVPFDEPDRLDRFERPVVVEVFELARPTPSPSREAERLAASRYGAIPFAMASRAPVLRNNEMALLQGDSPP